MGMGVAMAATTRRPTWRGTIPVPPSTNALYSGRRFKTRAYKDWAAEAGWDLKLRGLPQAPIPRPIVTVTVPRRGGRDLDNFLKATMDLLQEMRVIGNDNQVEKITISWSDDPAFVAHITVDSADGP